jgi:hypothetical protein
MKSVVIYIFLISHFAADAKTFLTCEFAKELGKNEGIERVYIPHCRFKLTREQAE